MEASSGPASERLDLVTGQTGYHASRLTIDLPEDDLVSYVFGRSESIDPKLKVFVNAEDEKDFITYDQAFLAIQNIAMQFKEKGLEQGDCVCIHSYNHIRYPLFWLGVVAAGGVVTGSNPAYATQELVHHFNITNTRLVIVHTDRLDSILKATEECQIAQENIFTFGGDETSTQRCHQSWNMSLQPQSGSNTKLVAQSDRFTQSSTLAAYAATSGTTGLPKAAGLSHRYFVAQLAAVEGLYRNRPEQITQLHCLPVFHAFAAPIALLLPLRLGISTYYLPRFHPQTYADAVHRFQITDTAVVPPIIATLSKLPHSQHELLKSLRFMICAGAPLATSVHAGLTKVLHPELIISQCWGCTEVGWISTFHPKEPGPPASVGNILPNTVLKIVASNGRIVVTDGVLGEAFIKSESMFHGYSTCDHPIDKSELCDDEGFYGTGDLVYVNHGKIYIQGRVKDIMKVNGWQVSPDEIQSVIMQLASQGIQDCAVVGKSVVDSDGLQVTLPRAYIVRSTTSSIEADDIRAHVKLQLVSYKQITRGVVFVDRIPRNPTGKIIRRLLEHANVVCDQPNILETSNNGETRQRLLMALCFVIGPVGLLVIAALTEMVFREW